VVAGCVVVYTVDQGEEINGSQTVGWPSPGLGASVSLWGGVGGTPSLIMNNGSECLPRDHFQTEWLSSYLLDVLLFFLNFLSDTGSREYQIQCSKKCL